MSDLRFSEITAPNGVTYMAADHIPVVHGFTTRLGGVSSGVYESLNLGEGRGDDRDKVRENYRLLSEALGITGDYVFPHQVHGDRVIPVTSRDRHVLFDPLPFEADGLMTDEPDLPLSIFTADCIPILLCDPVRGAVAAVHAGWRGTAADIAGKAVKAMAEAYGCSPDNIRAAIGPGIGKCCFETGPEVPEAMLAMSSDLADAIVPGKAPEKYMVDLKEINRRRLLSAEVRDENIAVSPDCTMCLHERYWSHRYTRGVRGSQASTITLKGDINRASVC